MIPAEFASDATATTSRDAFPPSGGSRAAQLTPSGPLRGPPPPGGRNDRANCSPQGELSAKLTEGVNGLSAKPGR
jgi:hypothetical protein